MPRLHGHAESTKFNHHDAIYLRSASDDQMHYSGMLSLNHRMTLFAPVPIGDGNRLAVFSDNTKYIQNWYARSNTTKHVAFESWTNTAHATIRIGEKPVSRMCIADLLSRREGMEIPGDAINPEHADMVLDDVARLIYGTPASTRYEQLPGHLKAEYRQRAAEIRQRLQAPTLMIVPPRQLFTVEIDWETSIGVRLEDQLRPGDGLWLHVEGFERRDVC